jgi:4-amino-4-deoxy-L-arabinose transferase-like glycosyltransferase
MSETVLPAIGGSEVNVRAYGCRAALCCIVLLAAVTRLWSLGEAGFGTEYYAASVRSMLTNPNNVFFAAFDPAGILAIDKPPLALWVQAISAGLFGFSPFTLMLPQAIEGCLSVVLIWHLTRRDFGEAAGLLAALFLALTPISIAVDRSNNTDSLLILTLLLAAWALPRRGDRAATGRLALAMALVGVAFNVKMMAAFGVLPGFAAAYFFTARVSWPRRIAHLAASGVALVAVSGCWIGAVALTSPANRPYVDSTSNNSIFDLVINHNAVQRFIPRGQANGGGPRTVPPQAPPQAAPRVASVTTASVTAASGTAASVTAASVTAASGTAASGAAASGTTASGTTAGGTVASGTAASGTIAGWTPADATAVAARTPDTTAANTGTTSPTAASPRATLSTAARLAARTAPAGPFRLFDPRLARQALWLLPLALAGVVGMILARRTEAACVWIGWAAAYWLVFSAAGGIFAPYYMVMLAPPMAVLAGAGVPTLSAAWRKAGRWRWSLPAVLVLGVAWQADILRPPDFDNEPGILLLSAMVAAVAAIVAARPWLEGASAAVGLTIGIAGLLIAPAAWSLGTIEYEHGRPLARIQPEQVRGGSAIYRQRDDVLALLPFLSANRRDTAFLAATSSAMLAAPLIIETGEPVVAFGGFMGTLPVLNGAAIGPLVDDGDLRFAIIGGAVVSGGRRASQAETDAASWIRAHGKKVDLTALSPRLSDARFELFDLRKQ